MKKTVSIIFAVALMASLLITTIYAASASIYLYPSKTQVLPGEEVEITVSLQGGATASAVELQISYDESVFTLVSGKWLIGDSTSSNPFEEENVAILSLSNAVEISGDIFSFKLKARADAAAGKMPVSVYPTLKNGSDDVNCSPAAINLEIPSCNHSKELVAEKNSTCLERGWDAYYKCGKCGQLFDADGNDINEIPYRDLSDHTGGTATCVSPAVCSVCGKSYGEINPDNHTGNRETRNAVDATCTEPGESGDVYCLSCNKRISSSEPVKALGHSYTAKVTAPTCYEKGYTTYTCSRCGDTYVETDTKTTGHVLKAVEKIEPTCLETGMEMYWICEKCGKTFSDANGKNEKTLSAMIISALGHSWGDWFVEKAPTENEDGIEARTCPRCGATETRTVPKLGHVHSLEKVEARTPTCNGDGNIEYYVCAKCKGIFKDSSAQKRLTVEDIVVKPLGHDYGPWVVTKEATETEEGEETRTCRRNSAHVEKRTISAVEHVHEIIYVEEVPATCETDGSAAYWTCSKCGRMFSDEDGTNEITAEDTVIKALGHDWGEWEITKEPQKNVKGEEKRVCKRDESHTETKEIEALNDETVEQSENPSEKPENKPEETESHNTDNSSSRAPGLFDSWGAEHWLAVGLVIVMLICIALLIKNRLQP